MSDQSTISHSDQSAPPTVVNSAGGETRSAPNRLVQEMQDHLATRKSVRRNFSTVKAAFGYQRVTADKRQFMQDAFVEAEVFPVPALIDPSLGSRDSVIFRAHPQYGTALRVNEADIEEFLLSHYRSMPEFRGLRRARSQVPVPGSSRRRADIVFSHGATDVICELKMGDGGYEAVAQLKTYIRSFERAHPDRRVKGILITGQKSTIVEDNLRDAKKAGFEIDWLCFKLDLGVHHQELR